jgi:hypothetical protein
MRYRFLSYLWILASVLTLAEVVAAADLRHLKEMPDPGRVLSDTHGAGELDTAARQAAAMQCLSDVLVTLASGNRGVDLRMEPEEKNLNGRYMHAYSEISASAYRILDPSGTQRLDKDSPRNKWNQLRDGYSRDEACQELLKRYLSSDTRQRYSKLVGERRRDLADMAREAKSRSRAAESRSGKSASSILNVAVRGTVQLVGVIVTALVLCVGLVWSAKSRSRAKDVRFSAITGEIAGSSKRSETHVSGSGGGQMPVSIASSVTVKQEFFIRSDDGSEIPYQLTNLDIPVRDGHRVSMIHGAVNHHSAPVRFVNHATRVFSAINPSSRCVAEWGFRRLGGRILFGATAFVIGAILLDNALPFLLVMGYWLYEYVATRRLTSWLDGRFDAEARALLANPHTDVAREPRE